MGLWDDKKMPSAFEGVKPKSAFPNARPKYALSGSAPKKSNVNPGIMNNNLPNNGRPTAPRTMEYNGGRPIGNADGSTTFPEPPPPPRQLSPLEILMEKLSETYQGPDSSNMDFSSLDKALEARMGMLNGARDRIRGNFDVSDRNTEGMHRAFENQVRTEDAARYNQIADTQKGNLTANMNQGVSQLEASRAKQVAERQAMLQALGQQEAGGAQDTSLEGLNSGIADMQARNNIGQNMAEGQRANNLSYNNTVAQSIGQAGVARRSALQQQLAGLLGKVDMAESEAQAQNQIERQRSMSSAGDAGYKQWNDNQNRMAGLFDTLTDAEIAREKMGMPGPEEKPQGLQAIAADLEGAGFDPQLASQGMQALSQILSGSNYLEAANGQDGTTPYDRVNVLARRLQEASVDPQVASAIAIKYGNL